MLQPNERDLFSETHQDGINLDKVCFLNGKFRATCPVSTLSFLLILKGNLHLSQSRTLHVGDLVLGSSQWISKCIPDKFDKRYSSIEPVILTGEILFSEENTNLRPIDIPLYISPAMRASNIIIDDVISLLTIHVDDKNIGKFAIIKRLLRILFSELILTDNQGTLVKRAITDAKRDQKVIHALSLIHQDPSRNWTLQSLAIEVGIAQSELSIKFRELVKIEPKTYLTRWRLQKTLALLEANNISLEEIAEKSGFQSERECLQSFQDVFGFTLHQYKQKSLH